jgi:hypothetical protein
VAVVAEGLEDCMHFCEYGREICVEGEDIQFAKYTWLVTSLDVRL